MRDLQGRVRFRDLLQSKLLLFFLLVLVVILTRDVYGVYQKNKKTKINRELSERRIDNLRSRKAVLESELARLRTARGVEEELRNKFQITKSGEEVLVIVDEGSSEATSSGEIKTPGLLGWLLKLFSF